MSRKTWQGISLLTFTPCNRFHSINDFLNVSLGDQNDQKNTKFTNNETENLLQYYTRSRYRRYSDGQTFDASEFRRLR